jgi:hypothetical protein
MVEKTKTVSMPAESREVWNNGWKPLPDSLHVGDSDIHGQGLMVKEKLRRGAFIGISHFGSARTAIGNWINHSDTPNCRFMKKGNVTKLYAITMIVPGEELTVDYRTHACGSNFEQCGESCVPIGTPEFLEINGSDIAIVGITDEQIRKDLKEPWTWDDSVIYAGETDDYVVKIHIESKNPVKE